MPLRRSILLFGTSLFLVARPASAGVNPDAVRAYVRNYAAGEALPMAERIPSFSRQTGLACSVCHTRFPRLTAFGRQFKLNGYQLMTGTAITGGDQERPDLKLNLVPPVSAMAIASVSDLATPVPSTQDRVVEFPDEFSAFIGGAIAPGLGTFVQFTYEGVEGGIGIDNVDIRYSNHTSLASRSLTYGFTLNNNPTSQDVWNSIPAWGFPFAGSGVAPTPGAATLIDGGLGQSVAGLGAYGLWGGFLYAEFTAYRSAPQGEPNPPSDASEGTIRQVAPYWRVALQHQMGRHYLMLGTYGMRGELYPTGIDGQTDTYRDIGLDAQYEMALASGSIVAHGTWIHERQRLDASFANGDAANASNQLNTVRADASYFPNRWLGFTVGGFSTTGDSDAGLYAPDPIEGSATTSPNSNGMIAQVDVSPWLNTRFGIQYTAYSKFNGASTGYDGSGRNASDNNTLYLFTWLAF